jgi:PKD repeat protein
MRTKNLPYAWLGLFLGVLPLIGCSGSSGSGPGSPPVAALDSAVTLAQVGTPVSFDASMSKDADGFLVSYRFTFADGSPSTLTASPSTTHYFPRAGLYDVAVLVTDNSGLSASASVKITISEDPIQMGCLTNTDCLPSELCVDGHCELAPECSDDKKCPPGLVCEPQGRCACPNGGALCGETCVDLGQDAVNCGHCGRSCERGQSCQSGHCVGEELCPDGLAECSGQCVDLTSDPRHCGFCEMPCGRGLRCENGRCLTDNPCERGLELCAGMCVDLQRDPNHCGKCFRGCPSGICERAECGKEICPDGMALCDGFCTDINFDAFHCGGCNRRCESGQCQFGKCVEEICPDGMALCNGFCADINFDAFHCGGCNRRCESGQCQFGKCVDLAAPGTVLDTLSSPVPFCVGLTNLDGGWYAINGRRIIHFDPFNGQQFGSFFVKGAKGNGRRRAHGLAAQTSMFWGTVLMTGAFDEDNFFAGTDLEIYDLQSQQQAFSLPSLGGGMAFDTDRNVLYVYDNVNSQLVTVNAQFGFEEARVDVPGLGFGEIILDLALDGQGNVWAVRPRLENFEPLMVKINIDTGDIVHAAEPPGMDGVGGVVLFEGFLYGAGAGLFYRMQP